MRFALAARSEQQLNTWFGTREYRPDFRLGSHAGGRAYGKFSQVRRLSLRIEEMPIGPNKWLSSAEEAGGLASPNL